MIGPQRYCGQSGRIYPSTGFTAEVFQASDAAGHCVCLAVKANRRGIEVPKILGAAAGLSAATADPWSARMQSGGATEIHVIAAASAAEAAAIHADLKPE